MKLAVVCLVLLPLALSASVEKRFLWGDIEKIFDIPTLKAHVQAIADKAGSDATEAQCETSCHQVLPGNVIGSGCPLLCKSYQSLVQRFHIA